MNLKSTTNTQAEAKWIRITFDFVYLSSTPGTEKDAKGHIQLSTWLNILVLVAETGQKGRDQICLPSTVYLLIDMLPTPRGVISTIMVSN